jgi:transcriptional regulator with XRE-family HTH domain
VRVELQAADVRARRNTGRAIWRSRTSAGVAAAELAAAVGVNGSTVLSWECGRLVPRLARLYQIADALGVPVDHLVG